jgi:membrane protein required for colicin V production
MVPILWFGYKGFTKGFVVEVISIFAFGLAIYAGVNFTDYLSKLIGGEETKYLPVISFSILFIGVLILTFLLGKLIEKAVNAAKLTLINKIAGAAFGGLKIALALSVLLAIIRSYDQKLEFISPELKESSLLFEPLTELSLYVIPSLEESKLFEAPIPKVEIKPEAEVSFE